MVIYVLDSSAILHYRQVKPQRTQGSTEENLSFFDRWAVDL